MPLKPGSTLKKGEYLATHDYIQSSNRCFFAIMQDDGNFVVYRGWDPDNRGKDLWATHTNGAPPGRYKAILRDDACFEVCIEDGIRLWSSNTTTQSPNYHAILQDDGNFVVYTGTPQKRGEKVWATNAYDRLVGAVLDSESNLKYHLDQAKTEPSDWPKPFRTTAGASPLERTHTASGELTATEEYGWSNSFGTSVEASTEFVTKIPMIAEGKIGLTVTASYEHTWSKSSSTTTTWTFSDSMLVPANTTMRFTGIVKAVKISVPYSVDAVVTLNSGQKLRLPIEGVYTGKDSYDVLSWWEELGPDGKPLLKAKPVWKKVEDATKVFSSPSPAERKSRSTKRRSPARA
jgi:hypothetical protein